MSRNVLLLFAHMVSALALAVLLLMFRAPEWAHWGGQLALAFVYPQWRIG